MPALSVLKHSIWILALGLCAQEPAPPAKEASGSEIKGLTPRAAPTDYQAHAKVGTITIGAEFMRHAVPTSQGSFSSEDYVSVETGFFGDKARISTDDFTLKINGKKPVPCQPYGVILAGLKDPEWVPPEPPQPKSKSGGLSTGGGGGGDNTPPPVPKMPMPLVHAMQQKVQKAALPEGDRTLPQAGLIFFTYRGRSESIKSVELIYSGPAGKATLTLQP